jgi:hypothetical protein
MNALYAKMSPDEVAYTRRMIDLAMSAPDDPATRDALRRMAGVVEYKRKKSPTCIVFAFLGERRYK